jgi:hypothetical protein
MDTNELDHLNRVLGKIYNLAGSLENTATDLQVEIRGMKFQVGNYCNECKKDHKQELLTGLELIQKQYSDLKKEMEGEKE